MSQITQFKPGMLCWTDLQTTDQPAARRFYGELFGWETDDLPLGPASVYQLVKRAGRDVAALAPLPADGQRELASHWNVYFWVKHVDKTVTAAVGLGGRIVRQAYSALSFGRLAVLADPSGATFSVWQAPKGMGAGRLNEHGAIAWPSLETDQIDTCRDFYRELFGWKAKPASGDGGAELTVFTNAAENRAEMAPLSSPRRAGSESHWTIEFNVDSVDRAATAVESLGGKVLLSPRDTPGAGRHALMSDPQHAVFGVIQASSV